MKIEQRNAQDYGSREPADSEVAKRNHAMDVMLLLITMLALIGAAAAVSIEFPWVLESAAIRSEAFPATAAGPQGQENRHQPPEEIKEKPEPFIADDVRTEGRMYASVGFTTSIPRSNLDPSGFIC